MLLTLWQSRALVWTLVKKDLKVRYKASALGFLWSFGRPLFLMLILWGVFSHIVRLYPGQNRLPYALHLLGGLLPWMYFSGAVSESVHSLLAHSNVIKKVALPTEVFPAATVFSHLIHFLLALFVLGFFMAAMRVWPDWRIVWLPALLVVQTVFTLALALLVAGLHVYYRDVASLVEILLSAWFYVTPIIYPVGLAEEKLVSMGGFSLFALYMLNPMAAFTAGYRMALFGSALHPPEVQASLFQFSLAGALVSSLLLWLIAAPLYRRMSRSFADEL